MIKIAFACWICGLALLGATPASLPLSVRSVVFTDSSDQTLLADLNGDGRPDLISESVNGFAVRLNNGSGRFSPVAALYPLNKGDGNLLQFSSVVADFNGDGRADVAAVTNLGIYVYLGDGKGGLSAGQRTSITTNVRALNATTADFNGDGIPDIASGLPGSGIRVFLGDGKGNFRERTAPLTGTRFSNPVLRAQDMNGDGFPDLVAIDELDRTVSILLNDGTGGFRAAQVIQADTYSRPQGVAVGDFDGDKRTDLSILFERAVLTQYTIGFESPVELWTQDNTGLFSKTQTVATGLQSVASLNTADVNGDGNLDLITTNATTTNVQFGDGSGNFGAVNNVAAIGQVLTADLDGAGAAELVISTAKSISVVGPGLPASRVMLIRNLNPFTFGTSEVFTVTVASDTPAPGFATGTVTLFDGSKPVATSMLLDGLAHFSILFVPGQHVFHAEYAGDGQFGPGYADLSVTEAGAPAKVMGYAPPVSAQVLDAGGNPVSGVGVFFFAPLTGPSGTFGGKASVLVITGPDGMAETPAVVPNGISGYYTIGIAVSGYPALGSSILLRNL